MLTLSSRYIVSMVLFRIIHMLFMEYSALIKENLLGEILCSEAYDKFENKRVG